MNLYQKDLPDSEYFEELLSSISPLVTLDEHNRILYVNEPFIDQFPYCKTHKVEGSRFFDVVRLNRAEKEKFLRNVQMSRTERVQNCEFKTGTKIFGYTMFLFSGNTGIILKDITETKKLQKKVSNLHSRLLELQEKERQRLARELHDGVGQIVLAAKLNFISYQNDPIKFKDRFQTGMSLIDRASQELREIYKDLYPSTLSELGLETAIRSFVRDFLELKNTNASLNIHLSEKLPMIIEVNLFRIIQEVITNIVKHANATKVVLNLNHKKNIIHLMIKDDGIGFDESKARLKKDSFGLENIRRRIDDLDGNLVINSVPGKGTAYEIQIPLEKE
ncbi:MAG: sensor histidine kinase [Leptospiraceae bacterium]|nr:sensor histidine kinase [Leptospiraceae bacterium]MCP5501689.1 sensor histidine kinase [Leptospiraceae bacterium]